MQHKTLTSAASIERLDREIERGESLDPMEAIASSTEPRRSRLDGPCRLAWRGVGFCNSFLSRWLNLCEVGVEDVFYAFRMRSFFAGADMEPVTAPQEIATFRSHRVLEEDDYPEPEDSSTMPGSQSKLAISWRTPWLYLIFLLLVWLLLF
jgi:hypothetical protein